MARKVVVELVDDLDGTPIEEGTGGTVSFSFDGVAYEIDLSEASRAKLAQALEPFIAAERRAEGSQATTRKRGTAQANSAATSTQSASGRAPTAARSATADGCPLPCLRRTTRRTASSGGSRSLDVLPQAL